MPDTEDDRNKRILGYIGAFAAIALAAGITQVIENRAKIAGMEAREVTHEQLGDIRERLATLEAACR